MSNSLATALTGTVVTWWRKYGFPDTSSRTLTVTVATGHLALFRVTTTTLRDVH